MIGTGIPAYAPGPAGTPRTLPSASRGQTDQHGSSSFDDAVAASGGKQERQSPPSKAGETAHASVPTTGQPADDAKQQGHADGPSSSGEDAVSHHGKSGDTTTRHDGHSHSDDDDKDNDRPHEKHSAGGVGLPLVMSHAIALLTKAAGESGADRTTTTKSTADAEQVKPATETAPAAAKETGQAKTANRTPPEAGAKIAAQSIRVDDDRSRSDTSSALANLRTRLSRSDADTAADASAGKATAAPKGEQRALDGKKTQPDSSDSGSSSRHDEHGGAAAGAAEAHSTPPLPAAASPGASLQARNIAALADAIVARPDWSQALAQGAGGVAGNAQQAGPVSSLKLQLNPADLGMVTATLRVSGNQLVINLQVQTAEAYRQLSTGNDNILDKLKGHGYAVENITVQHISLGTAAPSQQAQQQQHAGFAPQQGGQQAAAGGGQRFAGQGQGGRNAAPLFDPAGALPGEPQSDTGPGSRSAGGVYV